MYKNLKPFANLQLYSNISKLAQFDSKFLKSSPLPRNSHNSIIIPHPHLILYKNYIRVSSYLPLILIEITVRPISIAFFPSKNPFRHSSNKFHYLIYKKPF